MAASESVLVITHSGDEPAQLVIDEIHRRGWGAVRFDTDRFPAEQQLVLRQNSAGPPAFELICDSERIELSSIRSVWYRRFYSAQLSESLDPRYVGYSRQEARTMLSSLFAALHEARWVDRIERVHRAHHKVLQLELAKEAGLAVPDTLCTNDPEAARRFYQDHNGAVVTKMLNSISLRADGQEQMVFTTRVTDDHLNELGGLVHCPAVFQECVEKDVELRIAVVGRRLFVASIDTRNSIAGQTDWRRDSQLTRSFQPDSLPQAVEEAIFRLMKSYGLTYGSIDIIRRPDGEHVFLEINSAGEWAWLALEVGMPIHVALAEELTTA